jgi:Fanconi anemia group M protein
LRSSDVPSIIVDSRESRSDLANTLRAAGAEVKVEELECGDYIVADGVALERKAASDFVISIENRRIFSQLGQMKVTYERPMLLIEGDIFSTRSTITEDALVGALSYITLLEGVPVVQTRNLAQTAKMLLALSRHATDGLGYEIALRAGKPKDRVGLAQFLVEGLPGVGPSSAKKLLRHFGSAAAVLSASESELKQVAGVGPKMAAAIRETLQWPVSGRE